jgi:hypothetical protein
MKNVLRFLVLSALTGCAAIDKHEQVPGWPELKVVEHYVAAEEMLERCQQFARFSVPEGCTLFYFQRSEAHIYVRKDLPAPWVLKHERLHAAGYDHIGSTAMQRMLEIWQARANVMKP